MSATCTCHPTLWCFADACGSCGFGYRQALACVPPAAIGSASANLYAIVAAALLPVLGVLQGSLLAWVIAVATVTLPV